MEKVTEQRLAELLRAAEKAHAVYESELSSRDESWPEWYAHYILGELNV